VEAAIRLEFHRRRDAAQKTIRGVDKEWQAASDTQGTDAPMMPNEWFIREATAKAELANAVEETKFNKELIRRVVDGWRAQEQWEQTQQQEREENWLLTRLPIEEAWEHADIMLLNRTVCTKYNLEPEVIEYRRNRLSRVQELKKGLIVGEWWEEKPTAVMVGC